VSELRECPFCGGSASRHSRSNGKNLLLQNDVDNWISCAGECGAATCMHETMELAEHYWNNRAAPALSEDEAVEIMCVAGYPLYRQMVSKWEITHRMRMAYQALVAAGFINTKPTVTRDALGVPV